MPAVPATIHNELTRLLLILLLVSSTSEGQAADRFVSTAGSDAANNCLSSVSPCLTVANGLAQAASGDSVKVAGGNYRENVTISTATTLTLAGGWTADFSAQDPAAMSTVLQAAMQLPVVTSLASGITIDFTADGLTIQGGKNIPETPGPPCQDGLGGGICAQVSSLGSLGVALSRVTLTRNLANSSGGGLAAVAYPNEMGSSLNLTVTDSVVTGNAAGFGGGIAIVADDKPAVSVTLDHVLFKRNRAAGVHGAITTPFGGGLSIGHGTGSVAQNVQVLVQNSDFESNRSSSVERLGGGAGGVGAVNTGCVMGSCPLTVVNSIFVHNRAVYAGGIGVSGGATLVTVTATKNAATVPTGTGGGGVWIGSGSILDSILWDNCGVHPRDLQAFTNVTLDHCDVLEQSGPVTDLGGNISANPLFVAPNDIQLGPGSPCIDTGTCTGAPTTDFEGDPRPTGASCDMAPTSSCRRKRGRTPHPARTHRQPRKTSQAAISTPTTTSRVDDTPRWGAPTSTRPCEITAWWVPSSSYSTLTKIG